MIVLNNEFSNVNDGKEVHDADVQILVRLFMLCVILLESPMSHELFITHL